MKKILTLLFTICVMMTVDAQTSYFNMGTNINPNGETWTFDTKSFIVNDKRIIPVMGEIHYARVPESQWHDELLKMKAGGVTVISTYVFWIHHEEIENQYNWSGNRNLRKFLTLCKELNLPVILRIGPFCHGECRNGGFPDWIIQQGYKIRQDNPKYLAKVETWFNQIFSQVNGLIWKQGGPVIGIQIENEYRGCWEHLQTLKDMARRIGFDLPLYTRTGWPKLSTPARYGELIPLYGDYCDGFWDRELTNMPSSYNDCYFFHSYRGSTVIATEVIKNQTKEDSKSESDYPFFTCELGGGMATSYHRRPYILPMDIYSLALVKIANGSNFPGFYMYHGGINPTGKLTTMNENQRALITINNDLPVKTYDFQAPIGEVGQLNGQYHLLRQLHLLLNDFGERLSTMYPVYPVTEDEQKSDTNQLRWNYRTDGKSGFIFVNNYQRLKSLSKKENITFDIPIKDGGIRFPSDPITIKSGESFIMPYNMQIGNTKLIYAIAQPITKVSSKDIETYVFKHINGTTAEFAFDKSANITAKTGKKIIKGNLQILKDVKYGLSTAIEINKKARIILLDENTAEKCWKLNIAGEDHIIISDGSLMTYNDTLKVESKANKINLMAFPSLNINDMSKYDIKTKTNGIFMGYDICINKHSSDITLKKQKDFGTLRNIINGKAKVAEAPSDSDFNNAAVWNIQINNFSVGSGSRPILEINYKGDVARLYCCGQLIDDNFYNGRSFLYDLSQLSPFDLRKGLQLKILPMQSKAPIYIQQQFRFGDGVKDVSAKVLYMNEFILKVKNK